MDLSLHSLYVDTPVGVFGMIIQNCDGIDTVVASGFGALDVLQQRLPKELTGKEIIEQKDHPYVGRVQEYFQGQVTAIDLIPYMQPGSAFYQQVWDAMRTVAPGHPISYKELALKAEHPTAIRAAGSACAQNRIVLLVPCHRILKSGGDVGSYLYGSSIKKYLLEHEATHSPQ